jgi:TolB-like protein
VIDQEPVIPAVEPHEAAKRKKNKKDKVRSAWISFAGRIAAQVVGAAATVALGVTVLHQYKGVEPATRTARPPIARPAGEISLAVLPMENFSGDAGHDYLADGMTEMLIADLSKIAGIRVISRTSSMHFKGQRQSLRDIADALGAKWIVEGSIVRAGERLRITAQLIDAGADQHAWAETYDRRASDPLGVQAEVSSAIASAVSGLLSGSGE